LGWAISAQLGASGNYCIYENGRRIFTPNGMVGAGFGMGVGGQIGISYSQGKSHVPQPANIYIAVGAEAGVWTPIKYVWNKPLSAGVATLNPNIDYLYDFSDGSHNLKGRATIASIIKMTVQAKTAIGWNFVLKDDANTIITSMGPDAVDLSIF
jgi:hypothetical protein